MGPELTVLLKGPLETDQLIVNSHRMLRKSLRVSDIPIFRVLELDAGNEIAPSAFFWSNYFIFGSDVDMSEIHLIGAELKPGWMEIPRGELGSSVAVATPRKANVLERAVGAAVAIVLAQEGSVEIEDEGCNWVDENRLPPDAFLEKMTVTQESPDIEFALRQFRALLPSRIRSPRLPLTNAH